MIDRPIGRARLLPLLGLLLAACSTTAPTPIVLGTLSPTDPPTTVAPPPTPAPSVDPNGLPPTTTTGWWGDPDKPSECMPVGAYRIGYRVEQFGDCFGMPVDGPKTLTLDVGQDVDIHMTIPADGAQPIYSLPVADDELIARGWLIFDDATMTYQALSPGTTRLVSAGSCLRSDPLQTKPIGSPQGQCAVLIVHVRDIDTKCVELAADLCRIVAATAVLGLYPHPGQRIVGWVAQPDSFHGGDSCGEGVAKVTFTLRDPDGQSTVQIGRLEPAASGPPRFDVCTY